MQREEIEKIPENVKAGKYSWEQVNKELVVFIIRNKPLFGLQKYDEDFISELIISILDRGEETYKSFDKERGSFFAFVFCIVKNNETTILKKMSLRKIIEYHNVRESIANYQNKIDAYKNINFEDFDKPKIPYAFKPASFKDFQVACKSDSYHIRKIINSGKANIPEEIKKKLSKFSPKIVKNIIMVIALRAAYYITSNQIITISKIFDIDIELLYNTIQEFKNALSKRVENKLKIEMRRNRAYFQHKRLQNQMEWNDLNKDFSEYENETLNRQYIRNTKNWNTLNHQLEKGKIQVRPSNEMIAKALGLSVRQVTYYSSIAKKLEIDILKV